MTDPHKNHFVLFLLMLMTMLQLHAQDGLEVHITVGSQQLILLEDGDTIMSFPVSCSKYGVGQESGSNKTPLGRHRVHSKFGQGAASGAIFVARRPTGEIAEIEPRPVSTGKDHVTTRILWLEGMEDGLNKGPGVDSHLRYIYIHGTHEEGLIGLAASHGCIRMRNADVIELFEKVPVGCVVYIRE